MDAASYGRDIGDDLLRVIRIGEAAAMRIKGDGHWEDWLQIGEGLLALRQVAMKRAFTNIPTGKRYNEAFAEIFKGSPFEGIDKSPRSYAVRCAENRADIEQWRARLAIKDKISWTYPKTVWNRWQAYIIAEDEKKRVAAGGEPIEKKPSVVSLLKSQNAELVADNTRLMKSASGGSHIDLDRDSARDIAHVVVSHSLARAKSLVRELSNAIRAREEEIKNPKILKL